MSSPRWQCGSEYPEHIGGLLYREITSVVTLRYKRWSMVPETRMSFRMFIGV
jgi:hypothetical protein